MSRVLLLLVITTSLLGPGQVAYCLPPDKVRGSQVPSLREHPEQRSTAASHPTALVSYSPRTNFEMLGLPAPSQTSAREDRYEALSKDPAQEEALRDQQQQIWESDAMREARSYVAEFCRLSARISPEEGEQFLTQLSQLSPDEMQAWLERYQARRQIASEEQALGDVARQVQLGQAMEQQQTARRVYGNVKQQQRDFAAANPGGFPTSNIRVWQMRATYSACGRCSSCRVQILAGASGYSGNGPSVSGLGASGLSAAAYLNEINSLEYRMKAAAAASTPGDMLRSDPRNYMRGDFTSVAPSQNDSPLGQDLTFSPPPSVTSVESGAADEFSISR